MGKKVVCGILLLLIIAFIWGNSVIPGKTSMDISDKVVTDLGGTVTHSAAEDKEAPTFLNSTNVRKFAHVLEFAALGGAAAVVIPLNKRRWPGVMLLGLGAAVLDESIQIFSNRTSAIQDVWIDFAGFLGGAVVAWILLQGIKRIRKNGKQKREM